MKIVITLEHTDLIRQVEKMLAFQGMAPAGPIEFRKKKKEKGEEGEPGYEIVVACEPTGEPPDTCPTCGMSLAQTVAAPQETSGSGPVAPDKPRVYAVEDPVEVAKPEDLDSELGEMAAPPAEIMSGSGEDDEEYVPSIASLRATNERITRERERELAQRRGKTPEMMPGESTSPPKPGDGT
jgi:hypothetical protein